MLQTRGTFQLLFEENPHPMWVYDPSTLALLLVNEAALRTCGWSREAFLRMRLTDLCPPEGVAQGRDRGARSAQSYREAGVRRLRTKDDQLLEVRTGAWDFELDGKPAVLEVAAEAGGEAALKDPESLFHLLMERLPINVYLLQGGRIVYANTQFCATLGYGSEELLAAPSLLDFVVPEDRRAVLEADSHRNRKPGDFGSYRFSAMCKGGESVRLEAHATRIPWRGSEALLGIAMDLRSRFETEKALRLALELATMLAEAGRVFIALEDEEPLRRELLAFAERLLPTLSWSIDTPTMPSLNLAGSDNTERLPRSSLPLNATPGALDPDATQRLAPDRTVPLRAISMGGNRKPDLPPSTAPGPLIRIPLDPAATLVGKPRPERSREPVNATRLQAVEGLVAAAGLGLQRIRSQRALRDQELRLREIIDRNLGGIFRLEPGGTFVEINDAMARMFGLESGSLLRGRPAGSLFGSRHWESILARLRAAPEGKLADFETNLRRRDGKTFWSLLNLTLKEGEEGQVIQGSMMDITHRHIAEVWDRGQAEFLELVAQNQPLNVALTHLARMLDAQASAGHSAVLLIKGDRLHAVAAPGLPEGLSQAFGSLPLAGLADLVRKGGLALGDGWAPFRELAKQWGFPSQVSAPILSAGGEPLGQVTICGLDEEGAADFPMEILHAGGRLAGMALDHAALTDRLAHQAQYDALTDLPNRALFLDRLNQAIHHASRHGNQVAVLLLDLDGFKRVNDSLGHAAGDEMLVQVAQRFNAVVRKSDTLARLGGDEFLVLVTTPRDPRGALRVAHLLLDAMKPPFRLGSQDIHLSTSVGLSFYPTDAEDGDSLLRHADAAMYRAKTLGRNNLQCFTPALNAELEARMNLEGKLRHALAARELEVYYQPQVSAEGILIGFEALVRWPHPELGMVSPAKFIPIAEECGLIQELGTWVLEEACLQMAAWHRLGFRGLRVAVNVSPLQFERPSWKATVVDALERSRLDPAGLELEMTEGLVMGPDSVQRLGELRDLGLALAIDDFGTGYSSMSYLQHLPVHTLKIDQSFVGRLKPEGSGKAAAVVHAILNLAKGLGLSVVAEGVETEYQAEFLRAAACPIFQGYLYSKPLTAAASEAFIRAARLP